MSKKFTIYDGTFFCHECKAEVPTARFWKAQVELSWKCKGVRARFPGRPVCEGLLMDYNKREKAEAKRMGAKLTKNSGRGMRKGDGTWRNFLVDWKFAKKSFALNKDVWSKVVTDTLKSDREKNPALIIVLGEGNQTVRLAIIEQEVLEELDSKNDDMV